MTNEFMLSKRCVNVVVIGHYNSGKSTLAGHLLCSYRAFDESRIKVVEKLASDLKKNALKYAWLLDSLDVERERGITMNIGFGNFETSKYDFTIIDAPGHENYIMNMISGTSQADCAVLIIDSTTGGFEAGLSQTTDHALLAFYLGVQQIICCCNKMDGTTPPYSIRRYDEITKQVSSILLEVGYIEENITFLPLSGFEGDNMIKESTNLYWFKGPTLLKALNSITEPGRHVKRPLRLPIQRVYKVDGVKTVPVGCVQAGVLKPGMTVNFAPTGLRGRVNSVQKQCKYVSEALPGEHVGFHVQNIAAEDLKRGYVVSEFDYDPAKGAISFTARIIIKNKPGQIRNGYEAVLYCHTAHTPVKFDSILCKIDIKSGEELKDAEYLDAGEEAIVKMIPAKPLVVETCADFPTLGRFVVRDQVQTVAVGVVLKVEKGPA